MNKDYEALGRYVASCEALEKSLRDYAYLLRSLSDSIGVCLKLVEFSTDYGGNFLFDFDRADRAAAEANSVAGRAGKPPVRWR